MRIPGVELNSVWRVYLEFRTVGFYDQNSLGILERQRRSRAQVTVGIYSRVEFDNLPFS